MKLKTKIALAPSSVPGAVAKGVLWGLAITVLGASIISALMLREILKENAIGYSAMGILLLASYAGSKISSSSGVQNRWLITLLYALCYAAALLALNAIFYRGGYEGVGATILLIIGGSIAALLTGGKSGRSNIRLNKKRLHG